MHELGPEPNFNESMYFNVYDPDAERRRLLPARQPGQRGLRGEMTVCLYLPDGRVGFMFKRPEVSQQRRVRRRRHALRGDRAVRAASTSRYAGKVVRARRPARRWPTPRRRSPRTRTPSARCDIDVLAACRAMFGGEPDEPHEKPGEEFAKGHYEQLVARHGHDPRRRRRVGDRRLRPARPLVGPALLAGALVLPLAHRQLRRRLRLHGLAASPAATATAPAAASCGTDGKLHLCHDFEITHRRGQGDDTYHQTIAADAATSGDDKEWKVTGKVLEPHPAAQPAPDPTGTCSSPASPRA